VPLQGFGSFSPAAAMHDHAMDTRLNALLVEARHQEIMLRPARPRFDTTATQALAPSSARSPLRRQRRRLLRFAHARGGGR
jgi:hypothetical protein